MWLWKCIRWLIFCWSVVAYRLSPPLTPMKDAVSTHSPVSVVQASPSWAWKPVLPVSSSSSTPAAACSLCSEVCPTTDALQLHVRTLHRDWSVLLQSAAAAGRHDDAAKTTTISAAASPKPPLVASWDVDAGRMRRVDEFLDPTQPDPTETDLTSPDPPKIKYRDRTWPNPTWSMVVSNQCPSLILHMMSFTASWIAYRCM